MDNMEPIELDDELSEPEGDEETVVKKMVQKMPEKLDSFNHPEKSTSAQIVQEDTKHQLTQP
jgi:hypothetical protein